MAYLDEHGQADESQDSGESSVDDSGEPDVQAAAEAKSGSRGCRVSAACTKRKKLL